MKVIAMFNFIRTFFASVAGVNTPVSCLAKWCLSVSLFILLSISDAHAQGKLFIPRHYVGARGGAVASWVNFSPAVEHAMRYSFMAGAVYRMVSEKYFGFQVEANYVRRGWKESVDGDPYERLTGYIEIPFMTHITFGSKVCKGFVNLGPSISVLVHENNILSESDYLQRTMSTSNLLDYGIVGGVGFEVHTVAGVYQLDARYSFGLGDIFPSSAKDAFRSSSNQNIIVSLGWLFQVR